MTQQHSSEESTSCFVAIAVVGVLTIGVAVFLWPVNRTLAVSLSLLVWPTIGWVVAVLANRLRFGRRLSLSLTLSLLAATSLKVAFLLFLIGLALFLSFLAVVIVFSIVFGIVGTQSIEQVPWLVPLAASSIVLLCMIFTARNVLWPLVREFWGVDTGECEWQMHRDYLFDAHRIRHLDRYTKQAQSTRQAP